jgi:predicted nuclease of restriction endonuclease-like (RecB) superfamily
MSKSKKNGGLAIEKSGELFERIASILEYARANTVRAVNNNMLIAYWLIGKEIIDELQEGGMRAEYGKQLIEALSARLTEKYKKGFSTTNLWYFRQFYQAFSDRIQILHPVGGESDTAKTDGAIETQFDAIAIPHPTGGELKPTFYPNLSWSHYRALMRVQNQEARDFYETEASQCSWTKAQLERQIHSSYFERILKNSGRAGLSAPSRERLPGDVESPIGMIKSPYVLEFLDLPDSTTLHERNLESAVISQLQAFLLELGKGFAFVTRQKRMRYEDTDLYVDLVFYNCILKCYLLIDLKIGELSHQDVGQMDSYVRMFEDLYIAPDDNPTVGLILCTEKNEAVARYSVLNDREKIFASKYMLYLPTEEELAEELKKERRLIEERLSLLSGDVS